MAQIPRVFLDALQLFAVEPFPLRNTGVVLGHRGASGYRFRGLDLRWF